MNLQLAYTLDPPYLALGDRFVCASLACSADGRQVAVAAESPGEGGYPQVTVATSADSGATWGWTSDTTPTNIAVEACWRWGPVWVSADGRRLAATGLGGPYPTGGLPVGPVLVSEDSGASWVMPPGVADPAWGVPGTADSTSQWTGLAMSADGSRLIGVFLDSFSEIFTPGLVVQQAALAPVIEIGVSPGQLVLSWVVPSANYALEQSLDIGAVNWTNVTTAPVLNYSTLREQVTVPASGRQMFYRLVWRP
jgi:hypothetical protein